MSPADLVREIAALPDGVFRWVIGESRKQHRIVLGKKPVRRLNMKRDSADDRWSRFIHKRDGGTCQFCGAHGGEMEAAHVIGRGNRTVRLHFLNGLLLCKYKCHRWADSEGQHEFRQWWGRQYPERAAVLRVLAPEWKGWRDVDASESAATVRGDLGSVDGGDRNG